MNTQTSKPWWQSRTLWVNAVVLMLAASEAQLGLLQGVLPGGLYAWLAFALPVVNAGLRILTTKAVTTSTAAGEGVQ